MQLCLQGQDHVSIQNIRVLYLYWSITVFLIQKMTNSFELCFEQFISAFVVLFSEGLFCFLFCKCIGEEPNAIWIHIHMLDISVRNYRLSITLICGISYNTFLKLLKPFLCFRRWVEVYFLSSIWSSWTWKAEFYSLSSIWYILSLWDLVNHKSDRGVATACHLIYGLEGFCSFPFPARTLGYLELLRSIPFC